MNEEDIQAIESVSNTLLGMSMDPRIPADARECLRDQSRRIDKVMKQFTNIDPDDDGEV